MSNKQRYVATHHWYATKNKLSVDWFQFMFSVCWITSGAIISSQRQLPPIWVKAIRW